MLNLNKVYNATIVAVILNVALSKVLGKFATAEESKPPNGAASLSLKGQFMHMMVHHKQVLLTSSFIVGLVVALSIILGDHFKPVDIIFQKN